MFYLETEAEGDGEREPDDDDRDDHEEEGATRRSPGLLRRVKVLTYNKHKQIETLHLYRTFDPVQLSQLGECQCAKSPNNVSQLTTLQNIDLVIQVKCNFK